MIVLPGTYVCFGSVLLPIRVASCTHGYLITLLLLAVARLAHEHAFTTITCFAPTNRHTYMDTHTWARLLPYIAHYRALMNPDTYPEGDLQGCSIFSRTPSRSIFSTTGSALGL